MPGFELAKLAAEVQAAHPAAEGLLLLNHGLFTFGDTARESYERHIHAVTRAEERLGWATAGHGAEIDPSDEGDALYAQLAPMLRGILGESGPFVLERRRSERLDRFLARDDLDDLSQRGVPTPDHVIRTKMRPVVLRPREHRGALRRHLQKSLSTFRAAYSDYVSRESRAKARTVTPLDPEPRVFLVPGVGLITAGTSAKAACVAADLYEETIPILVAAEALGRYEPLPESDIFDMEYWSLEQAKLGKRAPRPLDGKVVVITGAASGIGAACANAFREAGAELFLIDRDRALADIAAPLNSGYSICDVADADALRSGLQACVARFGGIDVLVSNAGFAPQGAMHEVQSETFRQSFEVNFFAHQTAAAEATRIMRAQGRGGALLFNASKSAWNPGANFGPYAIPKAALLALMRQYAIENGRHGIRSNAVNADRVRTGLFPESFVAERAAARGLTPERYFESNLLEREVRSEDVAKAFLHLALAPATTGSVLTVDGGNIAAAPR